MNEEQDGLTRRRFVSGALITGAAAAWPAAAEAAKRKVKHKPHHKPKKARKASAQAGQADVVVVGAGFAGLTAARAIASAGHSVMGDNPQGFLAAVRPFLARHGL